MTKLRILAVIVVGLVFTAGPGCRLDLFRRGALWRQPEVVAPACDPCAPAIVDPCDPCSPGVAAPAPLVLPGPAAMTPGA